MRPVSASGPPSTNRPEGFSRILVSSSGGSACSAGASTLSVSSQNSSSVGFSGLCWAERTTVSSRRGRPSSSYSTVTWAFPSGRRPRTMPDFRVVVRQLASRWASTTGRGSICGVSEQAYPTMTPWSPAPNRRTGFLSDSLRCSNEQSTPAAISGLCLWMRHWTAYRAGS